MDVRGASRETHVAGRRKLALLFLCLLVGFLIFLPGTALAAKWYQGKDWSAGFNVNQRVRVCDRERDYHQAYTELKRFGSSRIHYTYDNTGANDGVCGKSGYYPQGISHHKTCEDVAGIPDPCNIRWSKHRR